ncbi:Minus-end-directed kinesin ATPase protein [Dioscorea alata]|uniref:Minus-end-directed kinesin ATPase protein n=1 Tax=Dioscorea alata TaxID=55571 RepID=A0ACB7U3I1_DIOAL|nr:Minus-end-directed kinesin ATPase protein [Dioscorea alata]
MGEEQASAMEAPNSLSPASQKGFCGPVQENEDHQPLEADQLDRGVMISLFDGTVEHNGEALEKETNQLNNQEPKPNIYQDKEEIGDTTDNPIDTFMDDCVIPSPALKDNGMSSFFGPDLSTALQLLGTKYNSLMKRYQEGSSRLQALEAECVTLSNKCLNECQPRYENLKEKYTLECAERKCLYNELIELKGNIRVFCRCRPLTLEEASKGYSSVLELDPSQDMELQIVCTDSSRKKFRFDHVFGPLDNQEAVFAETVPVVRSALDGYNVCIFAYGQTGTGKTYTMEGTSEDRGVNYRALGELFQSSMKRCSTMKYEFSISMLEVYNEKIRDLLAENSDQHAKRLEIKQTADGTQDVPGLVEAPVNSVDEVWSMLKTGGRNRSVGSTNANELSSRSHCLVRVIIKSENMLNGHQCRSNMWLVDLAGSERVGKIEVEGERLKESQFINKSLSALGDVISALASRNPHIPYRNSKLTHLLQSSLGGDCKTLMFVQISPSTADLGETLCSLNFATRVRGIEHGPVKKQSDPNESFKIKQLTEKLRQEEKETAKLNESLQLMHLKYASRENVFKTLQEKIRDAEQACKTYQQKVNDLENQLAEEKSTRHSVESREPTKYHKPPLPPIKQRPPLGKITNRMPPAGPRKVSSITPMPPLADKENNILTMKKSTYTSPNNQSSRARRISLTPVVRPLPVQRKRRASIAVLPNDSLAAVPERHQLNSTNKNHQRYQPKAPQRRNSVATFVPFTPLSKVSTVAATPDGKGKFSNNASNSSKYSSSPPSVQAIWRSKIPSVGSPRQRLRLLSSPSNSSAMNSQMMNKLCFSVQKRVIVGSPSHRQSTSMLPGLSMLNQALREKEIVGKLGTAQRVLCRKRRQSVI